VATLVDGRTASAAEMIAGALDRYDRGTVLGTKTFGKGCVQEYFDDASGAGVLRLTTLLYALPDGSPVQRVGLEPSITLDFREGTEELEREAELPGAMPSVRGPDVRLAAYRGGPSWPEPKGVVGPCPDRGVCAALERLGKASNAGRRARLKKPASADNAPKRL
jgi:carboxyl-terminal processing protease